MDEKLRPALSVEILLSHSIAESRTVATSAIVTYLGLLLVPLTACMCVCAQLYESQGWLEVLAPPGARATGDCKGSNLGARNRTRVLARAAHSPNWTLHHFSSSKP